MRSRFVSDALDAIILKAIDKRADRRYQSARELLVDLQRCTESSWHAPFPVPPRRLTRRRVIVAGTVGLATAAAWWRFGLADEVSAAFPARGWAVIADFENRSGDPQIERTVQESLLLALQQSSYVNVFSRDRMFDALRRMRQQDVERIPEPLALEVCRRENAQLMLAGSIVQSGGATRITVRALSPAGELLFAEIVQLGEKEQFFARIDDLARRVRRRLGESLDRIQQASEPLDKVTTQSFDALRLYTQAVDRIAKGALDEALRLLQAALTLDPQFAMAHRQLARVFGTVGDRQKGLEHLTKAYELREMSPCANATSSRPPTTMFTNVTMTRLKACRSSRRCIRTTSTLRYELATSLSAVGEMNARFRLLGKCPASGRTLSGPANYWCCCLPETTRKTRRSGNLKRLSRPSA